MFILLKIVKFCLYYSYNNVLNLLHYSKIFSFIAVIKKIKKRTFSMDKNSKNFDTQNILVTLFLNFNK